MSACFVRRQPIAVYFLLTFALSWSGALAVVSPYLLRNEEVPRFSGLLMFPAMIIGPSFVGVFLTTIIEGTSGVRKLLRELLHLRVPKRWYAWLAIPPALVLTVLLILRVLISRVFSPNHFFLGAVFGIPAGILEEIGWTGFAFPRMQVRFGAPVAAIYLGLLWSLWHLPVIAFLGAASKHGNYVLLFFLAFSVAMSAIRLLISLLYMGTQSLFMAQLMHISSTAALVIFGPFQVNACQEAFWYFAYGVALWTVVATIRQ
jgi:uncharacterized protein